MRARKNVPSEQNIAALTAIVKESTDLRSIPSLANCNTENCQISNTPKISNSFKFFVLNRLKFVSKLDRNVQKNKAFDRKRRVLIELLTDCTYFVIIVVEENYDLDHID